MEDEAKWNTEGCLICQTCGLPAVDSLSCRYVYVHGERFRQISTPIQRGNMSRLIQVDSRDGKMPAPLIALAKSYKKARHGDIVELLSTERTIKVRIQEWCHRTGNKLLRSEYGDDGVYVIDIEVTAKGNNKSRDNGSASSNGLKIRSLAHS